MKRWITDTDGDLINLEYIEYICIMTEDSETVPPVYQIAAIKPDGTCYQVFRGTLEECTAMRAKIKEFL